jgi:hypothetical protein
MLAQRPPTTGALSWSDQRSLVLPSSKNGQGAGGTKTSQRLLGGVGPFWVDRGSAHASSRAIEATLLPGAAAQFAGVITADRTGGILLA